MQHPFVPTGVEVICGKTKGQLDTCIRYFWLLDLSPWRDRIACNENLDLQPGHGFPLQSLPKISDKEEIELAVAARGFSKESGDDHL